MFESCHRNEGEGFKCIDVAEKLMHLFSWRQKYNVQKLQRSLTIHDTDRFNKLMQKWQEGIQKVDYPGVLKSDLRKSLSTDVSYLKSVENDLPKVQKTENHKSCLSLHSSSWSADSWVAVQSLQTSDGGILDPDDRLNDVVDDREQIIANFSDGDGRHNGGGDGASGSSVGTESPDIFQGEGKYYSQAISATDIEVTGDQPIVNVLQVRRGSEPALNQIEGPNGAPASATDDIINSQANKRWSAAPIILDVDASESSQKDKIKQNGFSHSQWPSVEEEDRYLGTPNIKFQRDGSNRLSMQFTSDETGYKWLERANHVRGGSNRSSYSSSLQRDNRRREPLGQANSNTLPNKNSEYVIEEGNIENLNTEFIVLRNEGGPLGIHVVPDYDSEGRDRGLLVQGIEPGGRVYRDGRLAVSDTIIEINGCNLLNEPFQKVQEIFKNSLSAGELRLKIVKHNNLGGNIYNKGSLPVNVPETNGYNNGSNINHSNNNNMVEGSQRMINCSAKVATVSPTKKLPAGAAAANILQSANTRKMGRRIDLELLKGPTGLGFSITTRDNPAGGNCPIYIKNILPKGAAVDDGRLRPGDRLLKVNDIEMTGKTQPEAVAILRQAPTGSIVKISVSRQDDNHIKEEPVEEKEVCQPIVERNVDDVISSNSQEPNKDFDSNSSGVKNMSSPNNTSHKIQKPPRSLDDSQIFPWRHREILTFDIPVHDTEKAGLGVSVKGKTSANHSSGNLNGSTQTVDLGIFVKSVINGGAASRDGRLRTNDQLLSVNGKSLLYQSNANAMETLRRAMLYINGPKPGIISLTIARRVSNPGSRGSSSSLLTSSSGPDLCRSDSDGITPDHSVGSEASDSTVIFLPQDNNSYKSDSLNDSHVSPPSQRSHDYSSSRNPVIDRLTGHVSGVANNALRNESYYRATHESTWNTSNMVNTVRGGKLSSPTVNPVVAEPVLIEEDYHSGGIPNYRECGRRPSHDAHANTANQQYETSVNGNGPVTGTNQADVTYASQLSLDENAAGFSRDAFGRQSMSEKRHATLDAKNTDTYRRNKKLREERQERQQVPGPDQTKQNRISQKIAEIRQELLEKTDLKGRKDIGPALGMKKSSSLESLQTMVQEIQMAEDPDPAYTYRNSQGAVRVIRGRGCNDSFRAAVDRSYDGPMGLRNQMETPVSEEEMLQGSNDLGGNILGRGTPRQSSMNAIRDPKLKQHKKKPGLLKGIGSMFRFGKHRKGMDPNFQGGFFEEEALSDEPKQDDTAERQREEARIAAEEEHEKIQEQYRKLIRQQQENKKKFDASPGVNGGQPDQKYTHMDTESDDNSNMQWRKNEGNYKDHVENNNKFISPVQVLHDGRETDNNRNKELESRIRNRSYDLGRDRESEKFRKFSLDSTNLLDERNDDKRDESPQSRNERMQKLRVKHQKKHLERRGQYPSDEREEKYEQNIRQGVNMMDHQNQVRAASYDFYGEMGRPGSRTGISDPAKFSHYVNYEEIQQHLNRKKQHYHSQRREKDFHQRPVSNFYEYESIQSGMRSHQTHPSKRSTAKASWQDGRFDVETTKINASSLPRRIDIEEFQSSPSVKSTINYINKLSSNNGSGTASLGTSHLIRTNRENVSNVRAKGPFISQITIKENPNES
ncbi:UNVERIFIED_CONTAM: hypothetical protein PYX00_009956 [Menopon gallinae]|uniref:PDZ domain-containing protein n=1 Tax=Menopon gallinae TaxID=328185 RepID=A0AAW2HDD7_9NEOP